jgi:dipeptidyl aminopeptidase/acylaminoacyl peptidase
MPQDEPGPGGRPGERLGALAVQDALGNLPPAENPFLQGNVVDIFDMVSGSYRPSALRGATHGEGALFANVEWSGDGRTLVTQLSRPARLTGRQHPIYLQPESNFHQIYDARLQLLKMFDRPETNAPFVTLLQAVSSDEVILNAVVGLSSRLYYYNHVSGEFRQLPVPEGSYFQFASTHQSRRLVFTLSSFQQPHELFRVNWDGQALAQLTFVNEPIKALSRIRADFVTFTLRNGARRSGFLVQPADAPFPPRNVPIVVWQEGGPTAPMSQYWGGSVEAPHNLLPNFGIAVLHVPLPGRLGFGANFLNDLANGRNFGQIDIDEGAEIVGQIIGRGYTSPSKIGVSGCSYGGYFVDQSITRHPKLYAAANSQCALDDLFNEYQYGFTGYISYLEGRTPFTDPGEIVADSPINRASRVRTPLLSFHGTNDFLPVGITRNFHDQLELNKVPVELLTFAGEGHGLQSPVSQFVAGQAQINWFREYLR